MKILFYSLITILFFNSSIYATPPVAVQAVVVPQRIVEFDANYFQGQQSYYSVGDKLRAEKQVENTAQIEFYKGQNAILMQLLQQGRTTIPTAAVTNTMPCPQNPNPTPITPVSPTPDPTVPPSVPTNTPDSGEYKVTEVDKKVYNIFKAKCSRCHGDTAQEGGLALIKNDYLQLVDLPDRVEIYDRTLGLNLENRGKVRMPKGGQALTDDEVETLRLWMIQESDQIRQNSKR